MKYLYLLILFMGVTFGQFKEDLDNSEIIHKSLYREGPSSFFANFLSSENFQMRHSVTMSYSAFEGNGVALGIYTNSMTFKFAENLDFQLDASFVNSPYNTLGKNFTDNVNGVYISNAKLNYKPSEKTNIILQFRQIPNGYGYYGYGYGYPDYYYRGFGRRSLYGSSFFDD
ncbi:MAG: hypothetical protein ACEPO8_05520 [Rhodothermaceae bacterium]